MPAWSVLVVDDNPLVRQAVCELFTRDGDFDVCGEAENGREAIEKAQLLCPSSGWDRNRPGLRGRVGKPLPAEAGSRPWPGSECPDRRDSPSPDEVCCSGSCE
jgi:hypothetical protein